MSDNILIFLRCRDQIYSPQFKNPYGLYTFKYNMSIWPQTQKTFQKISKCVKQHWSHMVKCSEYIYIYIYFFSTKSTEKVQIQHGNFIFATCWQVSHRTCCRICWETYAAQPLLVLTDVSPINTFCCQSSDVTRVDGEEQVQVGKPPFWFQSCVLVLRPVSTPLSVPLLHRFCVLPGL